MTDKMREAMIDKDGAVWEKIGGAWSLYRQAARTVPEGWKVVFAPFDCHGVRKCPFCGCNTNANAMACCNRAAKESNSAARNLIQ